MRYLMVSVVAIIFCRTPFKIINVIICSILIFVIDLCIIEITWQKSLGNKSMDEEFPLYFSIAE